MSLAPVITISRSVVAARSLRYPEKEKKDSDQPRVLYRDGINCRPETAVEEFAQLRRTHGHTTETALRKVPATYTLPEPGEDATHHRKAYPGGRKYWAEPKDGETPTHVRREGVAYEPAGREIATHRRAGRRWIEDLANATHVAVEGGYVRGTEAISLIYSFDLASVNPHDAADTERAFNYVGAEIEEKFRATDGGCAVQAKLVAQADAKGMVDEHGAMLTEGGKFHVHAVLNVVQAKDMALDGEITKAGRKLSAKATDIEWIRDKHDDFARTHPKWGFAPQPKNREEREAEKRSTMDRRMAASGRKSNHDIIRDAHEASMDDSRVSDLNSFIEIMHEDYGITVNHRGKKKPTLSYRLDVMSQPVRGQRLGDHYDHESTLSQLEAKAAGLPRRKRPQEPQQLPKKPDPVPTQEEADEARRVITELAYEESLDQWLEDRAAKRGTTVVWLSLLEEFDATDPEDRRRLHQAQALEEAKQPPDRDTTALTSETAEPRPAASDTKIPEDLPITSTEGTAEDQPRPPEETAAQRGVRRHREEKEHSKTEIKPDRRTRKPSPPSKFTYAELHRRARDHSEAANREIPATRSPAVPEPSQIHESKLETVVTSTETLEGAKDSVALDHPLRDQEKQEAEHSEAEKPPQKSALQLAKERLERKVEPMTPKDQQHDESELS